MNGFRYGFRSEQSGHLRSYTLQGYLAHEKQPPSRTLQHDYVSGPVVALEGRRPPSARGGATFTWCRAYGFRFMVQGLGLVVWALGFGDDVYVLCCVMYGS